MVPDPPFGKEILSISLCYRDFSRFSEDWPGPVVVGFGSVTSVCRLSCFGGCLARWLGCVHPVPDFYMQGRSMLPTNDLYRRGERRTTIG